MISKWFDWDCFEARKESFKLLRRFRRTSSEVDKVLYLEANKNYHTLCDDAKFKYYKNIEIRLNTVRDSKEWWQLVKELKVDNRLGVSEIKADEFRAYFAKLLNPEEISVSISYAPNFIFCELLDGPITNTEIQCMLKSTKKGKSAGEDKLTYEFCLHSTEEFKTLLATTFTHLYNNCIFDPCRRG